MRRCTAQRYTYVNIDDCWQASERDATTGALVPDATKFPHGMRSVADYVHAHGLLLGIYTSRGDHTCAGRPGSRGHEATDAHTFASWGEPSLSSVYGIALRRTSFPMKPCRMQLALLCDTLALDAHTQKAPACGRLVASLFCCCRARDSYELLATGKAILTRIRIRLLATRH
jgi:hypothetical protein